MAKDLILIGGGGHCKACIDVIESQKGFKIKGLIDLKKSAEGVLNYEIIGVDKDVAKFINTKTSFLIAIGSIKDAKNRAQKFLSLKKLGAQFAVVISSLAHVAKSASIQEGTIVMHKALVNADARVGANCIINTAALIEHDVTIGDHCHISTGAIINGRCTIGKRVFIGSNSVIAHNVDIADDVIIGAGAVVIRSINKAGTYVGNPARKTEN
jgi:sugar O-acyltransferase (sialic acid O-acetyltransferase NeuD family)